MPDSQPARSRDRSTTAARVAAALCALEAVVLLAFAGYFVAGLARGAQSDLGRAVGSVVLIVLVAGGLAALAWCWWSRRAHLTVPTVVWHALLLPVAVSLAQSGQPLAAAGTGGVAIAGIAAAAASGSRSR